MAMRSTCLALLGSTLAVLALAAPAPAERLGATFHDCGDVATTNSFGIEAKRVGCPLAKRVVRAYNAAIGGNNGFTHDVLGFHCRLSGGYGDGGLHRCTASGHRVVKFARGG